MPTSVGPNTKGEENLVFGYDLGDVSNSYKGEPVQNLWDDMLNTQSLRTHTKHYWDGRKWIENATYSHPGVEGPKGTYLGIVFKHTSGALSSIWSGNSYGYMLRDIACTNGATMTMSSWIYASTDCDVTAIPAVIEQEAGGESSVSGYASQYDLNNKGTWQVVAKKATSDGQVRFIPLYPRKDGVTDGSFAGFFMWALPQVTYGDHVVQPIQPGTTRSATQGLLDLTGNSTIDLTNVSFDSNAQITFDGTNDYISIPNTTSYGNFTAEVVIKPTSNPNNYAAAISTEYPGTNSTVNFTIGFNASTFKGGFYNGSSGGWHEIFTSLPTLNVYAHYVLTYNGTQMVLYKNGTSVGTLSTTDIAAGGNPIRIGRRWDLAEYFPGDIDVAKVYDRALTASEVQSNYKAVKSRFNI